MPLPDRPDFQTWFTARNGGRVGRQSDDPTVCDTCGSAMDHALGGPDCLVCLAEQFGAETAEMQLAEAIAAFAQAAGDPPTLSRLLADAIAHVHDLVVDGQDPVKIEYEAAEDGWIVATIRNVPGVFSQGRSRAEARSNVLDALRLMRSPEPEQPN
jgi:predicted RNase H-like HicB family nuclease